MKTVSMLMVSAGLWLRAGAGEVAPEPAVAPFGPEQAMASQQAWAKHLGRDWQVTSAIGLKLALIPPGRFMMGSPADEAGRQADEELREVSISKPFYLGVFEVTQDEYERLMKDNPSYRAARLARTKQNYDVDTSRFPVERVSWLEAVEFCRRLSELPGEKAAGRVYRLPTEAEWEYACRAGTVTPFPFGTVSNGGQANVHGRRPYGTDQPGPSLNRPATVGSYPANAFGLHDMIGNKWEWVADHDGPGDGGTTARVDPMGPEEGTERVIRGGAWRYPPAFCRSAVRHRYDPRIKAYDLGFRVAMSIPEGKPADGAAAAGGAKPAPEARDQAAGPEDRKGWVSPTTGMEFVWIAPLGIWVGKYETTNAEFRKMLPGHDSGLHEGHSLNGDRQPVVRVNFAQARDFAAWLTAGDREAGGLLEGHAYRMPFEREWLAFARCGTDAEFPWGAEWPPTAGNYRGAEAMGRGERVPGRDGFVVSCDVEQSGSNPWGLYGVGGNVWEGCCWEGDPNEAGAWRGGSWDSGTPGLTRSTFRSVGSPGYKFPNYGFRLVLAPAARASGGGESAE